MRDHPLHGTSILGGLWGVRGSLLRDIDALVARYPRRDAYDVDQRFLEEIVAPRVCDRWVEHHGYFAGKPFPTRGAAREFVGQPFDEHDRPLIEGPSWLEERLAPMRFRRGPVVRLTSGARRFVRRAWGR
jgi:hypothetical protein